MKRLVFLASVIFFLFIIQNLVRSIYTLWQKHDLVVRAQQELEAQKKENQEIKEKLRIVETQEFVEQEARNKLFLARPGETSMIIDQSLIASSSGIKTGQKEEKANWQQWLELFF